MLKLFRKRRGAVSIFLIIVLVPILMVSSVFIDMSRIKLAGAIATSAGDLALNTALTDYDAVLKDMYGLFATSQDIDELLVNLEDYYRKSIEAAGIPEADAENYVDQAMSLLKSSTGTDDLMNMELTNFSVTTPTGASLGNPAILKSQIVEFMKYRAPINLGTGFIEALKGMKNLDKQTELVDNKTDFYTKQQSLLAELEKAWVDIQTYQYSSADFGFPTGNFLADYEKKMDDHALSLKNTIIPTTIKYLTYSTEFKSVGASKVSQSGAVWMYGSDVLSPIYSAEDEVTGDMVFAQLNATLSAIKSVDNMTKGELYGLIESTPNDASDIQKIYLVAQYHKSIGSDYPKAIRNLVQCLVNLKSAVDNCPDEELAKMKVAYIAEEKRVEYGGSASLESVCTSQYTHLNLDGKFLKQYNAIVDRIDSFFYETKPVYDIAVNTVNTAIGLLANDTKLLYWQVTGDIEHLTNAIGHMQTVKDMLSNPDSEYNKALDSWSTSASGLSDDSMGQGDLKEIEEVKKFVTVSEVDSLITRLTNAKTSLEGVKAEIEKYKFEATLWKDISTSVNYTNVKSMMAPHKTDIQAVKVSSAESYDEIIKTVKNTVYMGDIKTEWTGAEEKNNPDLTVDQRKLYTWLYNNYYDKDMNYTNPLTEKTSSGDENLKKSKENLQNKADEYKDSSGNESTKVDANIAPYYEYLPYYEWTGLKKEIDAGKVNTNQDELLDSGSGDMTSLLGDLMGAVEGMATGLRDNLYVTDYIMRMFSYNTFEAEQTLAQGGSLNAFSSWYEKDDASGDYKVKETYAKYAANALSLTNNSINPNMNYLYGSEIEYIIYGDTDLSKNITKCYSTIFLMRFAFNTVYAFTDAEINNTATAMATAVFGAPPLTALVPIARVAIIIGFAIAESTYDLYVLKKGEAVPLMKTSDTWTIKASNAGKAAVGAVVEEVVEKGMDVGYEVLSGALEKTDEELEKMINSSTNELSEMAKEAASASIDKLKNYANEAIQELVSICNDINVQSMYDTNYAVVGLGASTEKVQLAMDKLDEWLATQGTSSDDMIYEVKSIAVEKLKENDGESITQIFDVIETSSSLADGSLLNDKLDEIQLAISTKIDTIAETANTKLKDLREELSDKVKEAAKNGAESLKTELKNQISNTFGTSSGSANKATTNVVSSLLSWTYSDYLTLFLLINMMLNEENILLRMADVIELNMQNMNGEFAAIVTTETITVSRFFGLWKTTEDKEVTKENQKAFSLSNSYTYLTIDATMEVKPLFMKMPFMSDTVDKELPGNGWYQVHYTGTMGY